MKKTGVIIVLLCCAFWACSRKAKTDNEKSPVKDSLPAYLSLANEDNLPLKFKQKYNQKALAIILEQQDDSVNKANFFKVANRYYNMGDWKSYFKTTKLILERSEKNKDSATTAKAYSYLGDYYIVQSIPDSAFLSYYKAEKLYLRLKDEYNIARTFLNKASLQYNEGDFFESEITVFKALSSLKKQKKVNELFYESYNLLGILYNEREEYAKALEFQTKALQVLEDQTIPAEFQYRATSLNNVGYVYMNMNDYKQAKDYFVKALKEKNLFEDKAPLYATLLDNLAYSKFKLKESDQLPELFKQSLKVRDSLGLKAAVISSKIHLSEYFAFKKDTFKAIQFCKQALTLARSSGKTINTLSALRQIAIIDPQNAAIYSKEYIHLNGRMLKAERSMGEKFSRIEYETNEIKDQNFSLQEKNKTLVYVFSICTLIGLFFYVYKTQQAKNRELLFKQQQQIANEDIYNLMLSQQNDIELTRIREKKKVAQDLHDGVLGRMFGVRISLDSLDKIDEAEAAEKRKKYLTELKNIEEDIREISHDLSREKSELINNFVVILNKLFENQQNIYNAKVITFFDPQIKWELVENAVKINLYRIVQEALQNCNKYSEADFITVEFKSEINHLILSIFDNGKGFDTKRTKNGIGLHNIEYRAKECKGSVNIKSGKGKGTLLVIKVPIDQKINLQNNDS
ncbi:tetratricopeptide repeat-containing sensor histidine kinase [Flavobacterium hercynium]|uniref:histidine kinase n=1 Tax=Flavobacterium hercynium TaxID=387094 RepID=A0A226HL77_9FLAO|nr:ATP-binding protein [Flavobacterium hercynium]OXA95013.1 sensor histidine kinase [Flavobacterium hercynium]SMP09195.1 Tetratricopeptide repeat-containing protein [Flavobacterium hercynium]